MAHCTRDNQTRRIQWNITNVEKHFGQMCQLFAAFVSKTAKVRNKADLLVREISLYADTETPSLKRGLKQYADHLAKIQDYRQAQLDFYITQNKMCIIGRLHLRIKIYFYALEKKRKS
uniref:Uncharacterized protein n=1 Tax=Oreochromis niloticus TaxID=8128 RepID=A0A669D339_ORENI